MQPARTGLQTTKKAGSNPIFTAFIRYSGHNRIWLNNTTNMLVGGLFCYTGLRFLESLVLILVHIFEFSSVGLWGKLANVKSFWQMRDWWAVPAIVVSAFAKAPIAFLAFA